MKKNVLKMGLLALAIALAMAACAEPKNDDGGNKSATTIRLYLDRGIDTNLLATDTFTLTIGEEILTPVGYPASYVGSYPNGTYPYPRGDKINQTPDAKGAVQKPFSYGDSTKDANGNVVYWTTGNATQVWSSAYTDKGKHMQYRGSATNPGIAGDFEFISNDTFQSDRQKVLMIKPGEATGSPSVINRFNNKKKVLWSGEITLAAYNATPTNANLVYGSIEADTKQQFFVDILLYDATLAALDPLTLFTGSMSAYIELDITGSPTNSANGVGGKYYYTPGKNGFNDQWKYDKVDNLTYFKTDNANIKKVSLKSGINELRLSNFSNTQFQDLLR